MRACTERRERSALGFTLLELLVALAAIALLVVVAVPLLGRSHAEERAVLCESRMDQLTEAMLMYSYDFDETLPFIGCGFENLGDNSAWRGHPRMTYWAENENWLVPHVTRIWNKPENDWPADSKVQRGTLFSYARFEDIYRCPEFEQISGKSQNRFNYTRTVLGRRLFSALAGNAAAKGQAIAPGAIMKLSAIHKPDALYMLLDERWDFHVAGNYGGQPGGGALHLSGYWMGADPVNGLFGDCIGDYHAPMVEAGEAEEVGAVKKGNVAYYDGHVELVADPMPGRVLPLGVVNGKTPSLAAQELLGPFAQQIFAQRGIIFRLDDILRLFG